MVTRNTGAKRLNPWKLQGPKCWNWRWQDTQIWDAEEWSIFFLKSISRPLQFILVEPSKGSDPNNLFISGKIVRFLQCDTDDRYSLHINMLPILKFYSKRILTIVSTPCGVQSGIFHSFEYTSQLSQLLCFRAPVDRRLTNWHRGSFCLRNALRAKHQQSD